MLEQIKQFIDEQKEFAYRTMSMSKQYGNMDKQFEEKIKVKIQTLEEIYLFIKKLEINHD